MVQLAQAVFHGRHRYAVGLLRVLLSLLYKGDSFYDKY